eukprot:m.292543 g.292543  ORF g.292543 m.292543 type:complete len:950 (-) comp20002_c0_seq2:371-3220(-)
MAVPNKHSLLPVSRLKVDDLVASRAEPFVFGAMALLVDNAVSRASPNIGIFASKVKIENGDQQKTDLDCLFFSDDGKGLNPTDAMRLFCNIQSRVKPTASALQYHATILRYGNMMCMSAMRIAGDAILFTKCREFRSCVLLSQSLQDSIGMLEENRIVTPIVSWRVPISSSTETRASDMEFCDNMSTAHHQANLDVIQQYSSFTTIESMVDQFCRITSPEGNLVVCFNLWTLAGTSSRCQPELALWDSPGDIVLSTSLELHTSPKHSLREYLSRLYLQPSMRVAIQGEWLHPVHPCRELAFRRRYEVPVRKFISAETHANHMKMLTHRHAKARAHCDMLIAKSAAMEQDRSGVGASDKRAQTRAEVRLGVEQARRSVSQADQEVQRANRRYSDGHLTLVFGLNIEARANTGLLIYHCGRLIRLYDRAGLHTQHDDPTALGAAAGVVGFVNLPSYCLHPLPHYQGFTNPTSYKELCTVMDDHLYSYWHDIIKMRKITTAIQLQELWSDFGYVPTERNGHSWCTAPSQLPRHRRVRKEYRDDWFLCERCCRWQKIDSKDRLQTTGRSGVAEYQCRNNPARAGLPCVDVHGTIGSGVKPVTQQDTMDDIAMGGPLVPRASTPSPASGTDNTDNTPASQGASPGADAKAGTNGMDDGTLRKRRERPADGGVAESALQHKRHQPTLVTSPTRSGSSHSSAPEEKAGGPATDADDTAVHSDEGVGTAVTTAREMAMQRRKEAQDQRHKLYALVCTCLRRIATPQVLTTLDASDDLFHEQDIPGENGGGGNAERGSTDGWQSTTHSDAVERDSVLVRGLTAQCAAILPKCAHEYCDFYAKTSAQAVADTKTLTHDLREATALLHALTSNVQSLLVAFNHGRVIHRCPTNSSGTRRGRGQNSVGSTVGTLGDTPAEVSSTAATALATAQWLTDALQVFTTMTGSALPAGWMRHDTSS